MSFMATSSTTGPQTGRRKAFLLPSTHSNVFRRLGCCMKILSRRLAFSSPIRSNFVRAVVARSPKSRVLSKNRSRSRLAASMGGLVARSSALMASIAFCSSSLGGSCFILSSASTCFSSSLLTATSAFLWDTSTLRISDCVTSMVSANRSAFRRNTSWSRLHCFMPSSSATPLCVPLLNSASRSSAFFCTGAIVDCAASSSFFANALSSLILSACCRAASKSSHSRFFSIS
mmetsp:Transcript_395/g.914  ORF Transcript_395/g.914 Transcript_395/m.914 type:complete len:231 (+) Transcript_395:1986-2678(+)